MTFSWKVCLILFNFARLILGFPQSFSISIENSGVVHLHWFLRHVSNGVMFKLKYCRKLWLFINILCGILSIVRGIPRTKDVSENSCGSIIRNIKIFANYSTFLNPERNKINYVERSIFVVALWPNAGYGPLIHNMTPLDEWSARRRGLYLTTHNIRRIQTRMAPGGFWTRNPSKQEAADPKTPYIARPPRSAIM